MKENLAVLNQRGTNTPVILGGVALTRKYVEEDCRQIYKGQLFYAQDAFDDLHIMEALAKGADLTPFLSSRRNGDEAGKNISTPSISAASDSLAPQAIPLVEQKDSRHADNNQLLIASRSKVEPNLQRSDVGKNLEIPTPPFLGQQDSKRSLTCRSIRARKRNGIN